MAPSASSRGMRSFFQELRGLAVSRYFLTDTKSCGLSSIIG